ncbi:DUF7285 family protein [Haloarchaeobius iranensis]|uniref:Uncharacterized protein n=1 Tax=Haloarchaeobius iranensis TaxID=996166 RepID=A0A1G9T9E8_9EURY|nr:hypothetical protein [Haloarchaeobius iranensis]SDM44264.1 hypothetical protein SAMN05192554_102216 [Haloarchaeobius iranensis]
MSRWSTRRGQVEPTAALVAVFAVAVGLTLYAGALDSLPAAEDSRSVAEPTLSRVHESLTATGVANPADLHDTLAAGPDGYHVAVTLAADGERWRVGPAAPPTAATAARPVSVRIAAGVVVSGRLRVEVWA